MRRAVFLLALVACAKDKPASSPGYGGTYEDWDSYDDARVYVKEPVITVDREAGQVRIEADGYFPTVVTVNPGAKTPFQARGMLLSRISRFYQSIGAGAWDPTTALVQIEVRREPSGEALDGVTISVNAAKGYRRNWNGGWSPTTVTGEGGAYFAFPNVVVSGGLAALQVRAAGVICKHPPTIHLAAGEVAFAQVTCTRR